MAACDGAEGTYKGARAKLSAVLAGTVERAMAI